MTSQGWPNVAGTWSYRSFKNQKEFTKRLSGIFPQNRNWVNSFLEMKRDKNRTLRTLILYLQQIKTVEDWLYLKSQNADLTLLNPVSAKEYLSYRKETFSSQNQLYCYYANLSLFYRWGVYCGFIPVNPFGPITVKKPSQSIRHCSDADIIKLNRFIRDPESDPELAIILALILMFGLTKEEMVHAQISNANKSTFSIVFSREPLTANRKSYNREQLLHLPNSPKWFISLQTRFLESWQQRFSEVLKLYSRTPLYLPKNKWYALPLNSTTFDKRLRLATKLALGQSISLTILRNTCGVIYSRYDDASMLTKLGWSRNHAFEYIRREREVYIKSDS
jgi:hypothetical protein